MMGFLAKMAVFTLYTGMLLFFLNGVANFAMAHMDFSSFMTPTICWFFTQLNAGNLLATYFSFLSVNWLKAKIIQYWTAW